MKQPRLDAAALSGQILAPKTAGLERIHASDARRRSRTARCSQSFQSGALVRGAGAFCCVAIDQYAVEGQPSVGSAVDACAPVVERLSDAAAYEGRLLATMPETVEASADELAPALRAVRPAIPVLVDGAAGHRKGVADTLARDGRGTGSCCGGSRG